MNRRIGLRIALSLILLLAGCAPVAASPDLPSHSSETKVVLRPEDAIPPYAPILLEGDAPDYNLGGWLGACSATWAVDLWEGGTYEVWLAYAKPDEGTNDAGLLEFALMQQDPREGYRSTVMEFTVEPTSDEPGDWSVYQTVHLGDIQLDAWPHLYITCRSDDESEDYFINLRGITLVKQGGDAIHYSMTLDELIDIWPEDYAAIYLASLEYETDTEGDDEEEPFAYLGDLQAPVSAFAPYAADPSEGRNHYVEPLSRAKIYMPDEFAYYAPFESMSYFDNAVIWADAPEDYSALLRIATSERGNENLESTLGAFAEDTITGYYGNYYTTYQQGSVSFSSGDTQLYEESNDYQWICLLADGTELRVTLETENRQDHAALAEQIYIDFSEARQGIGLIGADGHSGLYDTELAGIWHEPKTDTWIYMPTGGLYAMLDAAGQTIACGMYSAYDSALIRTAPQSPLGIEMQEAKLKIEGFENAFNSAEALGVDIADRANQGIPEQGVEGAAQYPYRGSWYGRDTYSTLDISAFRVQYYLSGQQRSLDHTYDEVAEFMEDAEYAVEFYSPLDNGDLQLRDSGYAIWTTEDGSIAISGIDDVFYLDVF